MPSSRNHSRNGTSIMANSRRSGSTQASFSWITKTCGVPALAKRCAFIELLGSGSCTALNIRANATNKKTWNLGARTSLRQEVGCAHPGLDRAEGMLDPLASLSTNMASPFTRLLPLASCRAARPDRAAQQNLAANVRLGSQADICTAGHVRFTPERGHLQCTRACPLWANSGHRQNLMLIRSPHRRVQGPTAKR